MKGFGILLIWSDGGKAYIPAITPEGMPIDGAGGGTMPLMDPLPAIVGGPKLIRFSAFLLGDLD